MRVDWTHCSAKLKFFLSNVRSTLTLCHYSNCILQFGLVAQLPMHVALLLCTLKACQSQNCKTLLDKYEALKKLESGTAKRMLLRSTKYQQIRFQRGERIKTRSWKHSKGEIATVNESNEQATMMRWIKHCTNGIKRSGRKECQLAAACWRKSIKICQRTRNWNF